MDETPFIKRSILGDGLRRLLDGRGEQRAPGSNTAMLEHGGRRHVVRIGNLSRSGAMIAFQGKLADGDEVVLHLLDQGAVTGQVRWSRDGRVGIIFSYPMDSLLDDQ